MRSVYENKFQIYCTFHLLIYPALPDRPIISQLNLVYQNINILFALLAQHVFTSKGTVNTETCSVHLDDLVQNPK
jgi:hypothetical protein